jgi:hypothetical protein
MRFALSMSVLLASAAAVCAGSRTMGSAESNGQANVVEVVVGRSADLVVLASGYDAGLRPGTVCTVFRAGQAFGSIVVADASEHRAVALILSLDGGARINPGDTVTLRANPRI